MKTPVGTSAVNQEANTGVASFAISPQEDRILRIERIAIRLFGVANCIVSFGQVSARFGKGERSMAALEAAFCDSLSFPHDPVIVNDARLDPKTATNPWVVGAPYIRFYASQPIVDNNAVVGAIFLIDYVARQYQEEDTFLLNDLSGLVEQELQFDSMQAAHDDMVRQNRSLRRDSMIDPMFGTWNRGAIVRSLEIEVIRCRAAAKPMSLAMVSVDNYADLKNEFGLHASEAILIKMVSRMRSCIRPFDALGRYGTEEFLVVLPGASHVVIQAITERIRSTVLAHPEVINDKTRDVTVCVGTVSTDVFTTASPDELMSQVEQALHSAKKVGNNSVIHAVPVGS
ncbi:sensor domain-containing diguanylate cyclase [Solimicrobium silvestre]|uniref:diguanylate cyclase n=1 Tax=Solimicrobium silvestre TaxID=2099400 RepID=A0A2S9GZC8_9BURK|nr:diguanylate cyclase [Solimicrobium silvestre]PRC93060.1 GGDEF: diguanylate cyclase (GGDEF) domain [Solimicrobium silvestre]